jgi:hypothetical protein
MKRTPDTTIHYPQNNPEETSGNAYPTTEGSDAANEYLSASKKVPEAPEQVQDNHLQKHGNVRSG